ncbi:hypothetical protein QEM14_003453 [Pseudomonas putida]|nr:hypothetical protein [Pseudomonas putida]
MKGMLDKQIWLEQFNKSRDDQATAKNMLSNLVYIDHDSLKFVLDRQIHECMMAGGISAIFVERELPKTKGRHPPAMYKEVKVRRPGFREYRIRAEGAAQQVVQSLRYNRQEVGSEGIIAQHMSSLCKAHKTELMFQPSADEIRKFKARRIVVVTDFIGSGERINRMLSSFWRVRSIRSWVSSKLVKMVVVCVSGTDKGLARVRRHPSRPGVILQYECPTIFNSFSREESAAVLDLCSRYGSFDKAPLGYGEVGALIAFEHSAPNNMPAVFARENKSRTSPWRPLFPERRTEVLWRGNIAIEELMQEAFGALDLEVITKLKLYKDINWRLRKALLIAAAIYKGRREMTQIIALTNMSVASISEAVKDARDFDWITSKNRMTDSGRKLVSSLCAAPASKVVTAAPLVEYYPSQLRAPT